MLNRLVLRNAAWATGERVIRGFASAIVGAWVARYLGPSGYASLAYAFAITSLLGPLSQLGLSSVLVHRLAESPEKAAQIVGTAFALRLGFGVVALVLCMCFAAATTGDGRDLIIVGIIGLQMILQPSDVFEYFYQSRMQSEVGAKIRVFASILCSIIKLALVVMIMPVWTFAAAFAFEFLLIFLLLYLQYRGDTRPNSFKFDISLSRDLMRAGLPFLISAFAISFYGRFDQLLIKNTLGAEELGIYAAVTPFFQALTILPIALTNSFMPAVSRAAKADPTSYYSSLSGMFRAVLASSVVVAVVSAIASPFLVRLLLGEAYARSGTIMAIFSLAVIPVALGYSWNVWVTISGRGKLLILNTICGAFTSLALNLLLVPRFGIAGAAIASFFSLLVAGFVVNVCTCPDIARMQLGLEPRRVR